MCNINWGSIIPSVVGGLIGAGSAYVAVNRSHKNSLKLNEQQRRQNIDGVLLAIKCELEVLSDFYSQQMGQHLRNVPEGEILNVHFRLKKNYFIVYPSNVVIVGQIKNPELVAAIVGLYNLANFLIETYLINNEYLEQRDKGGAAFGNGETLRANMVHQAKLIKEIDGKLKLSMSKVIAGIIEYRTANPVPAIPL